MIDYNIIATGSKGNAVVIDQKILIDCGVSFKALSKVYRALKLVLLTHIHDALHSVELDAEAPAPVIPGMVEPLAAMHAQGAERLTDLP